MSWLAAAQGTAIPAEGSIVDALVAGQDTSERVGRIKTVTQTGLPTEPRAISATLRFAIAMRELKTAFATKVSVANTDALLPTSEITRLRAANQLVEAEFSALEEKTGSSLERIVASRVSSARLRWRTAVRPLLERLEELTSTPNSQKARQSRAVLELLNQLTEEPVQAVYGATTLPVHRPRLIARAPILSLDVPVSYANSALEDVPRPEDLSAGVEAQLSPEVLAQASALGNDYIAIADFVRTQIRTQWYAGSQKGATETLRTRAGNDIDQASLLIALLRASNAAARYVTGVVEVPAAELAAQLGVAEARLGVALAGAGVPHRPVLVQGAIAAYRIEQVWVSAYLPLGNYRGSSADPSAPSWIPLMPALKPADFEPARPVLEPAGLNLSTWIDSFLAQPAQQAPWTTLRDELGLRLSQLQPAVALATLRARHGLSATPLGLLPASTPYRVVVVNLESAELLEDQRQWLSVVMRSGLEADSAVVLSARWSLSEIGSRRLGFGYVPATVEDQHLVNAGGGLGAVPAYLIKVRPSIWLDGRPSASGVGEMHVGVLHRIELELSGPAGSVKAEQILRAGGVAALALDPQGELAEIDAENVANSDPRSLRLLGRLAQRYQQEWSAADADSAATLGVSVLRPLPSATLAIGLYRVNEVLGLAQDLEFEGVALDALLRPVEPISQRNESAAEADWMRLSGLQGSALEHRLFKQLWAVDALSADSGLQLAAARNIPRLRLVAGQDPEVLLASHHARVRSEIAGWLALGLEVDVPRDPLTSEAWSGSVWRVNNPGSGESGYFLSGGYAGGVTLIPPDRWFFRDIAELLANPYAGEPNTNPLAGTLISLSAEAQRQFGTAGQLLPKPLLAFVSDALGRPVQGASVEFRTIRGGGSLVGTGGPETTVVAITDQRGIASVQLRMAEMQTGTGNYFLLEGQEFAQWATTNEVAVSVMTTQGRLETDVPYIAHTFPAAASKVVLSLFGSNIVPPGLSYSTFAVFVLDEYGNPVSNQNVTTSAADTQPTVSCTGDFASALGSKVFLPGMCPHANGLVAFLGSECLTSAATAKTQPGGALIHVVPSEVPGTLITVTATGSSGVAPASSSLLTVGQLQPQSAGDMRCRAPLLVGVVQWYHGLRGYDQDFARDISMEAALPNAQLPAPRRFVWVVGGGGLRVNYRWEGYPVSIYEVSASGATAVGQRLWSGGNEFDLVAGSSPAEVSGTLSIVNPISLPVPTTSAALPKAWVLDLPPPTVTPARIELTSFQRSSQDIRITAGFSPASYVARNAVMELLEDGQVVSSCQSILVPGSFFCRYTRGRHFEPGKRHTARYSINHGTPFFMQSPETELNFSRGIVVGFAGNDGDQPLPTVNSFVAGQFPKRISITHQVDISSQFRCENPTRFVYALGQPARVTLTFFRLGVGGGRGIQYWQPLDRSIRPAGVHEQELRLADLPFGEYEYEFRVSAVSDGTEEVFGGHVVSRIDRHDSLSLAHSFVKGVDLFLGHAVVSVEDMAVTGRGPGMHFTRTYSSHGGDKITSLGRGWESDLDATVQLDRCGTYIVTGSAGQGQRFVSAGQDPDGSQIYRPLHGYHSTLFRRADGSFDVFAKDGTRQHFGGPGARLEFIEDPNGNRITYSYESTSVGRKVTRITDSAGRQFDLSYGVYEVVDGGTAGEIEVLVSQHLLTKLRGPLDLEVNYTYDSDGNLATVTRTQEGATGVRREHYSYVDKGGTFVLDSERVLQYHHFGFRLERTRDDVADTERAYTYELQTSALVTPNGVVLVPEQRVIEVVEPDSGSTKFTYTGIRGLGVVTPTTVEDARGRSTVYQLNAYGAAETVIDPVGTTQTVWNVAHQQPARVTDALNTVTTYTYDSFGNKTRERIEHADGVLQRDWTYVPPSAFAVPILNRVKTHTDARRITTITSWDARGNLTGTSRGGVSESFGVAANGDRTSRTDGNGDSTQYRYDSYGHLIEERDPLGLISAARFDARGRQQSATDGNGQVTDFDYDALDRRVRTRFPATRIGLNIGMLRAESTTQYIDSQRRRIDTDENGRATTTVFDTMGRTRSITNALQDTRTFIYDRNGNRTSETDFRGNPTTMVYDAANRMTERHEPLGRSTLYTHDVLGHVLSETTAERVTEYRYAHPLYLATHTRRKLETRWLETVTAFDENGNPTSTTDPRGKLTTRQFDDRDRLSQQAEPEGRLTVITYDGADRKLTETLSGPLLTSQLRRWEHDQRGRETKRTDATAAEWVSAYDDAGNLISRTDPLAHSVTLQYDARNRLISESGPVPGRTMQMGYDAVGNRTDELHANGRRITHTFDALHRRTASTDLLGDFAPAEFERIGYDDDGNVLSRRDGNGNETTYSVDALNRITDERRPLGRNLHWTHTIHGEVLTATDAEGAITTHSIDSLGRITKTTSPAPFLHETLFGHDDANNLISQTNARGYTTNATFDGLNRRLTQTDPAIEIELQAIRYTQAWTYDAAGNVRTQRDRRGIDTTMTYDGENRLLTTSRDGVLKRTQTFDAAGNLATETDANANLSTHSYNAANERTQTTRPDRIEEHSSYHAWGDIESTTDADGITTTYAYDLRRRLISETRPHRNTEPPVVTTHAYDGQGNRIATLRPLGATHRWVFGFDAANRLQTVDSPAANPTTYGYDRADRRTRITDAESRTTTTTLDTLGRPTRIDYANGDFDTIDRYDGNGNIEQRHDGNRQRISSTFDALDRLSTRSYAGSAEPSDIVHESWFYNPNAQPTRIEQREASGTQHATQRSYDRQSRLDGSADRYAQAITNEFDPQDNRTARSDQAGRTVYQHDRLNRLRSVQPSNEGAIASEYTPAGRIKTQVFPNGARADYTYDAAGRIHTITHRQTGVTTATLTYVYDANGNRETETHVGLTGTRSTRYTYDTDDRLTRIEVTDEAGISTITDYTLDDVGNRKTEIATQGSNRGGTPIANKTYAYNARHQLTQSSDSVAAIITSYTYDANGFMTSETTSGPSTPSQTTTYRPNLQDRLATLTTPTGPPVHYAYDIDGLRVEKRSTVEATRYGYDGTNLRRETNVTNNPLATYDWAAGRVLRTRRATQTSYAQHDALKSPIRWSLASGAEQGRAIFDAWGIATTQTGTLPPIGFTGYYADQESSQYYAQQRYYSPRSGRFNRVDPGPFIALTPITSNRYLYANGNPLVYIDSDGRLAVFVDAQQAVGGFSEGSLAFAQSGRDDFRDAPIYAKQIAALHYVAGAAGYVASGALEAAISGANLGVNAVSIAAAETGAFLGSENAFTPLAAEARGEFAEIGAAAEPVLNALRADAGATAYAATAGVVTDFGGQIQGAANGNARNQIDLLTLLNPVKAARNLGESVVRAVEPSKIGAPTALTAGEAPDGSTMAIEQARDARGRFLPKDGSELQPGGAFESRVGEVLRETNTDVSRQIRIQTPDGTVTVLDYASLGPDGRIKLTEAKGSATAHLTGNQRTAIPQIQNVGGVVVGRGTDEFPRGTSIPPTPVRVVRPETIERLDRMRRRREEQSQ